jgi:hypothetical protein
VSDQPCPCGEIYELPAAARAAYAAVTAMVPPDVVAETPDGRWSVPRIYIAVHGLKAAELPELADRHGFPSA